MHLLMKHTQLRVQITSCTRGHACKRQRTRLLLPLHSGKIGEVVYSVDAQRLARGSFRRACLLFEL